MKLNHQDGEVIDALIGFTLWYAKKFVLFMLVVWFLDLVLSSLK